MPTHVLPKRHIGAVDQFGSARISRAPTAQQATNLASINVTSTKHRTRPEIFPLTAQPAIAFSLLTKTNE
jgi:hypothetical protein